MPGRAEEHRVALYLAGLKWRLFDIDFTYGVWTGFAAGATYR